LLDFNNFKENLEVLGEDIFSKKFLLAVSGGADSMVLSHLFRFFNSSQNGKGLEFQVAHVNYHFRGDDSNLDQKIVEDFCKKNKIKFHLKDVSEQEKTQMKSLQNWARELRYDFFFKILEQENLDYIVTAHHLNDELETFFINLSRGSGIKGLSGIPKNENRILRPLLKFTKNEIYAFAKENSIDFREDKSNEKDDYLRNKIRNQLTPKIVEIFPNFLEQFGESLSYLSSVNEFYQEEIAKTLEEVLMKENEETFTLNKEKLFQKPKVLIIEVIRKLGFSGIEIEKIISAENGKFFRSSTHEISINKKEILCKKRK
jgi:tRNA(Ile)-lysidine synthase